MKKKNPANSQSARFGAAVLGAIAIVLMVNIAANIFGDDGDLYFDITKERYTELSGDSVKILKQLDEDIYIYHISQCEQDDIITATLLQNYTRASEYVNCQMIDPGAYPDIIRAFNIPSTSSPYVVITDTDIMTGKSARKYTVLPSDALYVFSMPYITANNWSAADDRYYAGEQKITAAIEYIVTDQTKRAVFLNGHCEKTPCTALLEDIANRYYDISQFNFNDRSLDPLHDTLIVISPRSDLADSEYQGLLSFLVAGGQAIFFMDGMSVDNATGETECLTEDLKNFDALLLKYNLSVNNDVVLGKNPSFTFKSPVNIIAIPADSNTITGPLSKTNRKPVLSYASSIDLHNTANTTIIKLLETDASCYVQTPDELRDGLGFQSLDKTGSYLVGVISQKGDGTIMLYSSSSLAVSAENYKYRANAALFINSLNYMNQNMDSVSIPMKTLFSAADNAYHLNMTNLQKIIYIVIVAGVLPVIAMLFGVGRWLKRKSF